jgi:hypothetical protein
VDKRLPDCPVAVEDAVHALREGRIALLTYSYTYEVSGFVRAYGADAIDS